MIKAEIIKDSTNWTGRRLTTFVLTFPRYILAELNTHRAFSRNSGSSRAIPFKKMVKMVQENPFVPIAWQKDHTGMQGTEYFDEVDSQFFVDEWLGARDSALAGANILNSHGLTKQLCNRLLEPFMWHTAIITATDFENFFEQRCPQYEESGQVFRSRRDLLKTFHSYEVAPEKRWWEINKGMGEIHIMALAEAMWDVYYQSKPRYLVPGEWHLPYVELPEFYDQKWLRDLIKTSVAKCARVSYGRQDVDTTQEEDIKMFDRLVGSKPIHASPSEHQAQVPYQSGLERMNSKYEIVRYPDNSISHTVRKGGELISNIAGWIQLRKLIEVGEFN